MLDFTLFAEAETISVGGAVEDTGVRMGGLYLCEGFLKRVISGAVEFVFPADDFGFGEEGAESGKDFGGGFELDGQVALIGGDFFVGGLGDGFEVAKGSGVEDRVDTFGRERFEFLKEIVVG